MGQAVPHEGVEEEEEPRDRQSQQKLADMEAHTEQLENLLCDITATIMNIRTEVGIIDVVAQTATEEATANERHTKALTEEVGMYVAKLNLNAMTNDGIHD